MSRLPLRGVVLAAGMAGRMGALKPLLPVDGVPAAVRAARTFSAIGAEPLVVLGFAAEEVVPTLDKAGIAHVINRGYSRGMYSSVAAGLAALPRDRCLVGVLPADCPLVRPESVGRLAREAFAGEHAVVYPVRQAERGHPPLLTPSVQAEVLRADPPGGLRELLAAYEENALDVPLDDPGVTLDMDEPRDYARVTHLAATERLPNGVACDRLHAERGTSSSVRAHSATVARVAVALGRALNAAGAYLELELLWAAAQLHDICRDEPDHATRGAAWLTAAGFPRVAAVVAKHMDQVEPLPAIPGEGELLFLADKLVCNDRLTRLERRRVETMVRLADDTPARRAARRRYDSAAQLATAVESIAGRPLTALVEL